MKLTLTHRRSGAMVTICNNDYEKMKVMDVAGDFFLVSAFSVYFNQQTSTVYNPVAGIPEKFIDRENNRIIKHTDEFLFEHFIPENEKNYIIEISG